jgi:hypothetical protein
VGNASQSTYQLLVEGNISAEIGYNLASPRGHFAGGTVLYWKQGVDGKGVFLSGDIIQVIADHQWVSFMYSYHNLIPLPATEIQRIRDTIAPYQFERLYGTWFERIVTHDAHAVVQRSADRYMRALQTVLHSIH